MAQAPHTDEQRATGELLFAGTVQAKDFQAFLQAYRLPPDLPPYDSALMLLEQQPRRIIEPNARQDLLRFEVFDPDFDFTPYTSGRIFHALGELRWERQHAGVGIVYTGQEGYKPELEDVQKFELDAYIPKDRAYFLFGKRLNDQELALIGPAARTGDFAEVRIPRLLRYPPLDYVAGAERVQLVVREYIDHATARNVAYRFKSLVRFEKGKEQDKV